MGSVAKRTRDGKVTWLARWREPDGTERKKSFPRKVDAENFLTTVTADLLRGAYVDPRDRTTVADYARLWVEARPHRPTTAKRQTSIVETHLAPTKLGRMRLQQVRPSDVQAWVTERSQLMAPSTLRLTVSLLRSICASAVLDRRITTSPVVRIVLPRGERVRVVPLTVQQVQELAAAMPPRNRAMVVAQAGLGLRVGELLALRVEDVDFLRRTVRVEAQIGRLSQERAPLKTPHSRRILPLPQVVADVLAAHLAEFGHGSDGSLFATQHGNHYRSDYYDDLFRARVAATSLPAGTSSHDLRHHYASLLLAAGESVIAVAERLGHENASLVLSTYGHLMPDSEDRTRRAVDDAWRAPSVPPDAEKAL